MMDDLLAANRSYMSTFDLGDLTAPAAKGLALVTCMDSRIEPLRMLGLVPGDAKIVRNAGGRVTHDALRSLILATNLLGVHRIAVMHHTGCAMTQRTDEDIRSALPAEAAEWEFLTMADPDEALRDDVERVRACSLIPAGTHVEGWRYHVESGLVEPVVPG
jgi:carbonic anhydrase